MAFHIRLARPPGLTEHLVDVLAAEPGVTHVVVLPRSARRPGRDTGPSGPGPSGPGLSGTGPLGPGPFDAVQFDVPRRAANAVLGHLRAIRDDGGSSIAIVDIDA